jgi:hypothetical protein
MAVIDIRPTVLDLALYAGDGIKFRLKCTNSKNVPVDITGAVRAYIRKARIDENPPLVEFTVGMLDAYQGILVFSLTGEQTQELVNGSGKFDGVWDIEWDPSDAEPRTITQGKVECVSDVTR